MAEHEPCIGATDDWYTPPDIFVALGLCARTRASAWFHQWAVKAQTMCFPRGKTKFIRPDGSIGRAPGHGVVLLGMGAVANKALAQCGLGFFVPIDWVSTLV